MAKKFQTQTLMAVLAYVGILIIIPFLMAKDDPFVKFHIRQGLVLVSIELTIWVLGIFAWQLWQIFQIIHLGILILAIVGIVNAINRKEVELPLIGSLAHKFSI